MRFDAYFTLSQKRANTIHHCRVARLTWQANARANVNSAKLSTEKLRWWPLLTPTYRGVAATTRLTSGGWRPAGGVRAPQSGRINAEEW